MSLILQSRILRAATALFALAMTPGRATTRAADARTLSWSFESDEPGKIPRSFSAEVGTWEVAADGANRVLAQKAANPDDAFNIVLVNESRFKNVDIRVRVKAVAGEFDQGGGVVWRARDRGNYYVARYNPLESNFRVYKVENGKRTLFRSADIPGDREWHTLRVTMTGGRITCYLDGKKYLEAVDDSLPEAGRIGLWSKADARSYFDDLVVTGE